MERHPEPYLISKSSSAQIAWAAGLFEGEGFTVRRPTGKRVYLSVGMETRDLDVLSEFVRIMRANGVRSSKRRSGPQHETQILRKHRANQNPRHSDVYRWVTTGHTGRTAYELMRPYLGARRREKADQILAEVDQITIDLARPRPCQSCGKEFTMIPYGRTRRFCSKSCYIRWKIKQPGQREAARARQRIYQAKRRRPKTSSLCRLCGTEFIQATSAHSFCSPTCRISYHRTHRKPRELPTSEP